MARRPFGGTTADVAQDAAGDFVSGATLTAWTAETGGTQVTDLQTPAGVALVAGAIVTGAGGKWKFLGPADGTALLWVDGGSGVRYLVQATDITTRVSALEAGGVGGGAVASVNGLTGVVVLTAASVSADAAGAASSAQSAAISAAATDATTKANNAQSAATSAAATAAAAAYLPIPTAVIPAWATGQPYVKGQAVTQGGYFWTAAVAHTSGASFSGTVPGGNWVQGGATTSGASSAAGVAFTPSGTIAATDTQSAIVEAASEAAQKAANLSDLASAATARTNLGLGTAATANKVAAGTAGVLDATDASTSNSRTPTAHAASHAPAGSDDLTTALSATVVPAALGTAALGSGTGFARSGHVHPTTGLLLAANNLSDVTAATARTNLGLGGLATKSAAAVPTDLSATGTPSGTTFLRGDGSWATPAGGGGGGNAYRSGAYYTPALGLTTGGTALNTVWAIPFVVGTTLTASSIGVNVTGTTASSTFRLGIYAAGADGYPSALLLDAGLVATATTGFKEIAISQALSAGVYWLAAVPQTASTAISRVTSVAYPIGYPSGGSVICTGYTMSGVSGALPSTWTSTVSNQDQVAAIWVKVA